MDSLKTAANSTSPMETIQHLKKITEISDLILSFLTYPTFTYWPAMCLRSPTAHISLSLRPSGEDNGLMGSWAQRLCMKKYVFDIAVHIPRTFIATRLHYDRAALQDFLMMMSPKNLTEVVESWGICTGLAHVRQFLLGDNAVPVKWHANRAVIPQQHSSRRTMAIGQAWDGKLFSRLVYIGHLPQFL